MDDDGDDKDESKRRTRNLSEKKRRDQFNILVQELSTMVSTNSRKMDKSTVLKSTINFLKSHNEITVRSRVHDVEVEWKPAFMSNEEFTYLVMEALEGFVMVFSSAGRICYVSQSVTSLLGYKPEKVLNKSIFDLTSEEDRPVLYNLLQTNFPITEKFSTSKDGMVRFELHLKRGALDLRDETTYELVTFNGQFRTNLVNQDVENKPYLQNTESRICSSTVLFVGTGRLTSPQLIRDVSLLDPSQAEFTSRHSLEWKFLFLDHRAPPIIGYMPFEVLGTSGYDYYHFDDLEKVISCHEELMQKGELTSGYYRFLTKGQQWIWLQTRFYITYHQWHAKPEFVVCTHRVVSYSDTVAKGEGVEVDNMSEADLKDVNKEASSEEATSNVSHSTMSLSDVSLSNVSHSNVSRSNVSRSNMSHSNVSLSNVSQCLSESSDAIGSSYHTHSSVSSLPQRVKEAPSEDMSMVVLSPSCVSEVSDPFGSSFQSNSQTPAKRRKMVDSGLSDDTGVPPLSPSFASEVSDPFPLYMTNSQATSVKSTVSSAHGVWRRVLRHLPSSASASGDSHLAVTAHSSREPSHNDGQTQLGPQRGIGTHFLDPVPYANGVGVGMGVGLGMGVGVSGVGASGVAVSGVGASGVGVSGVAVSGVGVSGVAVSGVSGVGVGGVSGMGVNVSGMGMGMNSMGVSVSGVGAMVVPAVIPLRPVPLIATSDQAQIQEQLQRKHEELQQMIVRQQEELQKVKEQLLLARLGILQPVPFATPEQVHPALPAIAALPSLPRLPQIAYDVGPRGPPALMPAPRPPQPSAPLKRMPQ